MDFIDMIKERASHDKLHDHFNPLGTSLTHIVKRGILVRPKHRLPVGGGYITTLTARGITVQGHALPSADRSARRSRPIPKTFVWWSLEQVDYLTVDQARAW